MKSNFELLKFSCEFCCRLQKSILLKEKLIIDESFVISFEQNLSGLVQSVTKHIRCINDSHWKYWEDSIKVINRLYCELEKGNYKEVVIKSFQQTFLIYFQLLYQIDIDHVHYNDGEVRNKGELDEVNLYNSFMNRSDNVDGCKVYGIGALQKKPKNKNYSCISLDGLKALCAHLFYFKEKNKIKFKNEMTIFETFETLIDGCYYENMADKEKFNSHVDNKTIDKDFRRRVLIENRPSSLVPDGCIASFKIQVLNKVFLINIDIILTY